MNKLNQEFVERMESELNANSHKGIWEDWHPDEHQLMRELTHHLKKLESALFKQNNEDIKEFSADVANLCEKAFSFAKDLEEKLN